jgi:cytoskeleton protein RodZ
VATIAAVSTGIGDTLRVAREEQGRTLEDAARTLRVRTDYLRALEDERFDVFGGDIYAKGFLRNYAAELGLDPQPLLDTYRREVSHDDVHATQLVGGVAAPKGPRAAPPPWIAWVLVTVVVLAVLAFIGGALGGRSPQVATDEPAGPPPSPAPTAPVEDEPDEDDDDGEVEEEPEEEPEPEFDGVELLLALEEASWMQVSVDGTVVFEQTVHGRRDLPFQGDRRGRHGPVRQRRRRPRPAQRRGPRRAGRPRAGREVTYTPDGAEPA